MDACGDLHQQRPLALAGHEGRTVVAAFARAVGRVEAQTVLGTLRSVAAHAGVLEDRRDVLLESDPARGDGRKFREVRAGGDRQAEGHGRKDGAQDQGFHRPTT